jgi:hypothetical protein
VAAEGSSDIELSFSHWGENLVLWSCLTTWSRGSLSWKREKGNKLNNTAGKLWIMQSKTSL